MVETEALFERNFKTVAEEVLRATKVIVAVDISANDVSAMVTVHSFTKFS
jgi:hypothetical protein